MFRVMKCFKKDCHRWVKSAHGLSVDTHCKYHCDIGCCDKAITSLKLMLEELIQSPPDEEEVF